MRNKPRRTMRAILAVIALTCWLPCVHGREATVTPGSSTKATAPLVSPVPMPEPSSMAILTFDFLALGACGYLLHRRRRRSRQ